MANLSVGARKPSSGFYKSAGALAKNPLGVSALFIVMVYAVASVVIGFARAEFYQHPGHPSVVFLTGFPIVVLGAFLYLVTRHHEKLYAPRDYPTAEGFLQTLRRPAGVSGTAIAVTTSDSAPQVVPQSAEQRLNDAYDEWKKFGYCSPAHE